MAEWIKVTIEQFDNSKGIDPVESVRSCMDVDCDQSNEGAAAFAAGLALKAFAALNATNKADKDIPLDIESAESFFCAMTDASTFNAQEKVILWKLLSR